MCRVSAIPPMMPCGSPMPRRKPLCVTIGLSGWLDHASSVLLTVQAHVWAVSGSYNESILSDMKRRPSHPRDGITGDEDAVGLLAGNSCRVLIPRRSRRLLHFEPWPYAPRPAAIHRRSAGPM